MDLGVFTKLVEGLENLVIEKGLQDNDDWKMLHEVIKTSGMRCAPDSYLDQMGIPFSVSKVVSKFALGEHSSGSRWVNGLENEIHPLFSRDRWESDEKCEMTDEIFVLMKPALQLASLLLKSPAARKWFENVTTCPIKLSAEKDYTYFELPSEVEAVGDSMVDEIFAEMMKKLRFRFSEFGSLSGEFSRPHNRITLNKHYITHLRKDAPPNLPILFAMTSTICHEIGHAYFNYARVHERFPVLVRKSRGAHGRIEVRLEPAPDEFVELKDEPRYGSDPGSRYPELGRSIQFAIFRHVWIQINRIIVCSSEFVEAKKIPLTGCLIENKHRMFKKVYNKNLVEDWPEEPLDLHFVTGAWIQQWFLDETWKHKDDPLAELTDDASLGRMRLKLDYPIHGCNTILASIPGKKHTLVLIWPRNGSIKRAVHFFELPELLP